MTPMGGLRTRWWASLVPLVLTAVFLFATLAIRAAVDRRIRAAEAAIAHDVLPALELTEQVRTALAQRLALRAGLLLTGDPDYLELYRAVRAGEARALEELRAVADVLGAGVRDRVTRIEARSEQLAALADRVDLPVPVADPGALRGTVEEARSRHAETARTAAELRLEILRVLEERRAAIDRQMAIGRWLTNLLVLLALGSALAIYQVGRRLRQHAENAESKRRRLRRTMAGQTRLIRGITHDLKNPLSAVDANVAVLLGGLKGELAPEQRETLIRMRGALRSALGRVDNLLEASRRSRALPVRWEPADLAQLVQRTLAEHRSTAELRDIEFREDVPDDLPRVWMDRYRVRRIIENLLSNAVKYTPAGGSVSVRIAPADRGPGDGSGPWVAVTVTDTGPGIAADEQRRLFREFFRSGDPLRAGGSGLGLAVSRRSAQALGGDLQVESEPGKGSAFTLWLPLRAGPPGAAAP